MRDVSREPASALGPAADAPTRVDPSPAEIPDDAVAAFIRANRHGNGPLGVGDVRAGLAAAYPFLADKWSQTMRADEPIRVQLDRRHYLVAATSLTGAQLRRLGSDPIGPERQLWQIVPGESDRLIGDDDQVRIGPGLRLFSTPSHVTGGASRTDGLT